MEGGKDGENCNPEAEKLGVEEGEKEEEEDGEDALELGFYLGLPSGERRVAELRDGGTIIGGSKRDLEGVVVEREKSLFEELELSIGGSSSHQLPCLSSCGVSESPFDDGDFDLDLHFKRAKFDFGSQ